MPWASDKIRVFYRAGLLGERIMGKKIDSRNPAPMGRLEEANNMKLEVVEQLNFSQTIDFSGKNILEYNEEVLNGCRTFMILYYTTSWNDTEMYDNWTFSTPALWDEFWFSDLNSILYWSEVFTIGESAVELAQIQCVPELNVYREQDVQV